MTWTANKVLGTAAAAVVILVGGYAFQARTAAEVARAMPAIDRAGVPTRHVRLAAGRLPYLYSGIAFADRSQPGETKVESAPAQIMIFFTETDCFTGLADLPFWSELHDALGQRATVVGVTTGSDTARVAYYLKERDVRIPVLYDRDRILFSILDTLRQPITPMLIVADADGAVLRAFGSVGGQRSQQDAIRKALNAVLAEQESRLHSSLR